MSGEPAWRLHKDEEEPSYLKELLTHQYTLYGFLSCLVASTFLAIPYDVGVATLPLIGFAGLTSLAALYVPSSGVFRNYVRRKQALKRREALREHVLWDLSVRVESTHVNWDVYARMCGRVESLRALATDTKTSVGIAEVERLDDVTVDYLTLWLGHVTMGERGRALDNGDLQRRLTKIETQLQRAGAGERRKLEKARDDVQHLVRTRERLLSHRTAAETAMLAMSDAFEEVYQRVMANPTSGDATRQLQQAVERLRIEEELGHILDEDLVEVVPPAGARRARAAIKQGGG